MSSRSRGAHAWGHRGAAHSALVALLLAGVALALLRPSRGRRRPLGLCLALAALSHGLLDMATNGGLGVALGWPFDATRRFWPWRPIRVSPIGLGAFLSARGLRVLASEARWIGLPAMACSGLGWWLRRRRSARTPPIGTISG